MVVCVVVVQVGHWLAAMFNFLKHIPRYLIPCYFDAILVSTYTTALEATFKLMSRWVNSFIHSFIMQMNVCVVKFD